MFLNSAVMYRFDFSFNRTISKEELQQIELRINEVIRYASRFLPYNYYICSQPNGTVSEPD
jgi:alanyl-tRNA synthetase